VVFKPTWNVPDSIKVKELLPALAKNPQALARQGLRVAYQGKEIDPTTIDWSTTDIRALHVFQPPSGDNALGIVKFLFPNKHAVYLHDTPTKALFNQSRRTFSHGCIRVRNPVRLAEVLMEGDRNWTPAQVATQLAPTATENNHTNLTKKFAVHIAYFTAWANDAGDVQYFADVYGHEPNIHLGLEGKAHLIALQKEEKPEPIRAANLGLSPAPAQRSAPSNVREWSQKAFGGGN
jgi:L,D-transpeptidase YcbB